MGMPALIPRHKNNVPRNVLLWGLWKSDVNEAKEELTEELQEKLAIQEAFIEGTKEAIEDVKQKQRRDDAPDLELTEVLELTGTTEATEGAKESLEAIKSSMNLLEADLKGIQVDEQI